MCRYLKSILVIVLAYMVCLGAISLGKISYADYFKNVWLSLLNRKWKPTSKYTSWEICGKSYRRCKKRTVRLLESEELTVYSMISIAPLGHWTSQALQARHSSSLTTIDFWSFISNTSTGQVSTHVSHPSHFSKFTLTSTIIYLPLSLETEWKAVYE